MKPIGSGVFAAICGGVLLIAAICSFFVSVDRIPPEYIIRAWLFFVAGVLIVWGMIRISTANKKDWRIGQETINFVIGVLGATFVLLALLNDVAERKRGHPPNPAQPETHAQTMRP